MKYSEIKTIQTKKDFINFLRALKNDYVENLSSWENKDIEAFFRSYGLLGRGYGWFLYQPRLGSS